MSFWEDFGETIGYGIGAVIYGPKVALEQRHRRIVRRAFATWLGDEAFTKQVGEHGRVRRLVERKDDELSFLLECELRPFDDSLTITIPLERLPQLREDRVTMETKAPQSAGEWNELADGAVQKAADLIRRARGEGYR